MCIFKQILYYYAKNLKIMGNCAKCKMYGLKCDLYNTLDEFRVMCTLWFINWITNRLVKNVTISTLAIRKRHVISICQK